MARNRGHPFPFQLGFIRSTTTKCATSVPAASTDSHPSISLSDVLATAPQGAPERKAPPHRRLGEQNALLEIRPRRGSQCAALFRRMLGLVSVTATHRRPSAIRTITLDRGSRPIRGSALSKRNVGFQIRMPAGRTRRTLPPKSKQRAFRHGCRPALGSDHPSWHKDCFCFHNGGFHSWRKEPRFHPCIEEVRP